MNEYEYQIVFERINSHIIGLNKRPYDVALEEYLRLKALYNHDKEVNIQLLCLKDKEAVKAITYIK